MKKAFILFLLIFLSNSNFAAHIVSGTMHYTCLGNETFQFDLILYRDCFSGGALFDDPAPIAVYIDDQLYFSTDVPIAEILEIDQAPYEDCDINFPSYCIEKGIYSFNLQFPTTATTYTVVYQRCCWSQLITNLEEPGMNGITVKTDLTPAAFDVCNSQNIIDFPLSFAACPGVEVNYPIDQFDSEGDSLVYELCTPLRGAGLGGLMGEDPTGCDGLTPNPPCPGPFEPLTYATGFSVENPFPTENGITLDPATGQLSFIPTSIGRYVFGLCVTEYRDGQVLGSYTQPVELFGALDDASAVNELTSNHWEISQFAFPTQLTLTKETAAAAANFSLISIAGKILWHSEQRQSRQVQVPLERLQSGIYFIHIEEEGHTQTLKFVMP